VTDQDVTDQDVTGRDVINEYAGLYFWSFEDGRWAYDQTSEKRLDNPGGVGDYVIGGSLYTHYWGDNVTDVTAATLTVLADGSLQFTNIVDGDPAFQRVSEVTFGLHPWVRVGEAQ